MGHRESFAFVRVTTNSRGSEGQRRGIINKTHLPSSLYRKLACACLGRDAAREQERGIGLWVTGNCVWNYYEKPNLRCDLVHMLK
jgi:hypothetical protein